MNRTGGAFPPPVVESPVTTADRPVAFAPPTAPAMSTFGAEPVDVTASDIVTGSLVVVRFDATVFGPGDRARAAHHRLVAAGRARVLELLGPTSSVLDLVDGVAAVTVGAVSTEDELARRLVRALSGRVHGSSIDVTVVPRLDVATVIDTRRADSGVHATGDREVGVSAVELARAVERAELEPRFRPIVAAATEELRGLSAVLTWDHPVRGRTSPASTAQLARATGLHAPVDSFVIDRGGADLARVIAARGGHERLSLHVVISDASAADRRFVHGVVSSLRRHRLRPTQLVVTIDGVGLVGPDPAVVDGVRALRRIGVRVAVDRFGTAGDGLDVLVRPYADVVRLDIRRAVAVRTHQTGHDPGGNERVVTTAGAVVTLARSVGFEVLGTGVDDLDLLRRARAAGIDLVVGDAIGPAVPVDELLG